MTRPGLSVDERFWLHVDKKADSQCWPWTGATSGGYGKFRSRKGVTVRAHRFAYELTHGALPLPAEVKILHECDNPPCCNPAHLRRGTQLQNLQDMRAKGRHTPWNAGLTHCKRGHEFTDENTRRAGPRQTRSCRECDRKRKRLWAA